MLGYPPTPPPRRPLRPPAGIVSRQTRDPVVGGGGGGLENGLESPPPHPLPQPNFLPAHMCRRACHVCRRATHTYTHDTHAAHVTHTPAHRTLCGSPRLMHSPLSAVARLVAMASRFGHLGPLPGCCSPPHTRYWPACCTYCTHRTHACAQATPASPLHAGSVLEMQLLEMGPHLLQLLAMDRKIMLPARP